MPLKPNYSSHTSKAVRLEIQSSSESQRALSKRLGLNPKTVAKWKRRTNPHDMVPQVEIRSTVLSPDEERIIVAFRRHTLLPIDDCLYALQATIPHLTRSSLHRCFRRYRVNNLIQLTGHPISRRANPDESLGDFYINITAINTKDGTRFVYVATDLASRFAFIKSFSTATESSAAAFLVALAETMPYRVRSVLTDVTPPFVYETVAVERHMFALCCLERRIHHRITTGKVQDLLHGRVAGGTRMRENQPDDYAAIRKKLALFSKTYNYRRRLKALQGLTPFEYICRAWERHPERFTDDPHHLRPGLDQSFRNDELLDTSV